MTAEDVETIRAARERTIAAGSARITYENENIWSIPKVPGSGERGPVRKVLSAAAGTLGKPVKKFIADRFRRQTGVGVVDFTGSRWMVDFGGYATLQVGDHQWGGRAGRALTTLPEISAEVASPLWLIDLLDGVTDAQAAEQDDADDTGWQRYIVTASLAQAAANTPHAMPSPGRGRVQELDELPITVWVDQDEAPRLRQLRFIDRFQIRTMTLIEFAPDLEHIEWDRLPSFQSQTGAGHQS